MFCSSNCPFAAVETSNLFPSLNSLLRPPLPPSAGLIVIKDPNDQCAGLIAKLGSSCACHKKRNECGIKTHLKEGNMAVLKKVVCASCANTGLLWSSESSAVDSNLQAFVRGEKGMERFKFPSLPPASNGAVLVKTRVGNEGGVQFWND